MLGSKLWSCSDLEQGYQQVMTEDANMHEVAMRKRVQAMVVQLRFMLQLFQNMFPQLKIIWFDDAVRSCELKLLLQMTGLWRVFPQLSPRPRRESKGNPHFDGSDAIQAPNPKPYKPHKPDKPL